MANPPVDRRAVLKLAVPLAALGLLVAGWAWITRSPDGLPPYILPGPGLVLRTLLADWPVLGPALGVTLALAAKALLLATAGAVALSVAMAQSRLVELALTPYAVVLQVTPIVAIAPLLLVYVDDPQSAVLACAVVVAFFPMLANASAGLRSVDPGLRDLFALHGASRWRRLIALELPSALPDILTGLRIAGGLSLIAAVVAEFAAGVGGAGSGLAFRLLESQYRLNMPRLFAALMLLSLAGVAVHAATSGLSRLALRRWHASARDPDR